MQVTGSQMAREPSLENPGSVLYLKSCRNLLMVALLLSAALESDCVLSLDCDGWTMGAVRSVSSPRRNEILNKKVPSEHSHARSGLSECWAH